MYTSYKEPSNTAIIKESSLILWHMFLFSLYCNLAEACPIKWVFRIFCLPGGCPGTVSTENSEKRRRKTVEQEINQSEVNHISKTKRKRLGWASEFLLWGWAEVGWGAVGWGINAQVCAMLRPGRPLCSSIEKGVALICQLFIFL